MARSESGSNGGNDAHTQTQYHQMFDQWKDFYQKMAQDGMSMFEQSVATAQKLSPQSPIEPMTRMWMSSYQEMFEAMQSKMGSNPLDPQLFKSMYDTWLDVCSRQFESFMRTPEFVNHSNQHVGQMTEFQKKVGDMMEEYWHTLHLPNTEDMKELYEKLYLIERKMDDLEFLIRDIQSQLSTTNPASSGSTKAAPSKKK